MLDFFVNKTCTYNHKRRESEICTISAILEISGKLNLLVTLIVLGFFNFCSLDFIGGQYGVSKGVSMGSIRESVGVISRGSADWGSVVR